MGKLFYKEGFCKELLDLQLQKKVDEDLVIN
jgi:hypothetical protein